MDIRDRGKKPPDPERLAKVTGGPRLPLKTGQVVAVGAAGEVRPAGGEASPEQVAAALGELGGPPDLAKRQTAGPLKVTRVEDLDPAARQAAQAAVASAASAPSPPWVADAFAPPATAPTPPPTPEPTTPLDPIAAAPPAICPHCRFDLRRGDVPEPSPEDKLVFVQALVAGKPFRKEYPFLGGQLRVTFRTLSRREADACWQQVQAEERSGRVATAMESVDQLVRYRLCLEVCRVDRGDGRPDALESSLGDWQVPDLPPTGETVLPQVLDYVFDEVLRTESVLRVVSQGAADFRRLTARLEAMAAHPDFWPATAGPS